MGKRDYRHREAKKPKKDAKKSIPISYEAQPSVEVIKKGKKPSDTTED